METLRVKAAPGRLVRDPTTYRKLPEEGAEVPCTQYWLRRIRDGDVVQAPRPRRSAARDTSKEK